MENRPTPERDLSLIEEIELDVADFLKPSTWKPDPDRFDLQRRQRTVPIEGERSLEVIQHRNARSHLIVGNKVTLIDNNDDRPPFTDFFWGPSTSKPLPPEAEVVADALKEALMHEPIEGEVVDDKKG